MVFIFFILGCFTHVNAPGSIQSANHPSFYESNSECFWLITTDPYTTVKLTFTAFDIELASNCYYDHVDIFDGPAVNVRATFLCLSILIYLTYKLSNKSYFKKNQRPFDVNDTKIEVNHGDILLKLWGNLN